MNGYIDSRSQPSAPRQVTCRLNNVVKLLGTHISDEEIFHIFENLGLRIRDKVDNCCTVEIPSHRLDLTREVDLIEEVARLYGLNNIPAKSTALSIAGDYANDS